jgi:MarR family transcriptional regulator, lower aerobic nicotinate degradation pathway regulator
MIFIGPHVPTVSKRASSALARSAMAARIRLCSCCAVPVTVTAEPWSWLVSEVSRVAHRLLTGKLATAGSCGYHYRLLAALQEFGPASQAKLGRRTGMDRSDVVAAVNELAGRGLADRSPDPADGRRNIITITPAGTAHLRRHQTRKIVIMPATELRFGRAPGAWPLLGHIVALQRRPLALLDSLPAQS